MSSAIATPSLSGFDALADLKRASIESGEFIVMVAAVDRASHDGRPSFCACASCSIFLYNASMLRGAGIGPGRACAALMRALRLEDSLDIVHHYRTRDLDAVEAELSGTSCSTCDQVEGKSLKVRAEVQLGNGKKHSIGL
jgi:hypothetical protein